MCCAVTHLNLISTLSPTVGDHQSEGQHVCLGPWPVWHCRQSRHQRRMQTQLGPMCSDTFSILGRFRGTIWRWRKGIRAAVVTDVKINWYKLLSVLFLPAQWLDFYNQIVTNCIAFLLEIFAFSSEMWPVASLAPSDAITDTRTPSSTIRTGCRCLVPDMPILS